MKELKIFKYVKPVKSEFTQVFEITNKEHFNLLFIFKKEIIKNLAIQRCFILEGENIIEGPLVFISNFKEVLEFEKYLNPILKLKLIKNGFNLKEPTDSEILKYIKDKL